MFPLFQSTVAVHRHPSDQNVTFDLEQLRKEIKDLHVIATLRINDKPRHRARSRSHRRLDDDHEVAKRACHDAKTDASVCHIHPMSDASRDFLSTSCLLFPTMLMCPSWHVHPMSNSSHDSSVSCLLPPTMSICLRWHVHPPWVTHHVTLYSHHVHRSPPCRCVLHDTSTPTSDHHVTPCSCHVHHHLSCEMSYLACPDPWVNHCVTICLLHVRHAHRVDTSTPASDPSCVFLSTSCSSSLTVSTCPRWHDLSINQV